MKDELIELLGKRRSKLGIFDGDLDEGELEIGQIAAAIRAIKPAAQIVAELWQEYEEAKLNLSGRGSSDR